MINEKFLDDGIRLIPLMKGKLVFAEKLAEVPSTGVLVACLKRAGVVDGILPGCFSLFSRSDIVQVPVARAFFRDEPPIFKPHFGIDEIERQLLNNVLQSKPFENFEKRFYVKRNDPLLTVKEPFVKVLKYPDGRIDKKEVLKNRSIEIFCGKNTTAFEDSIISLIDGSAHQTKDGRVYVFPVMTIRGMGEIHGKFNEEISIKVTQDIHSHSYLESPSNIFVTGAIHSSFIKAGGNIQAMEGIDNTKEVESSRILSKGKIITAYIRKYRVHSKDKVIVSEGIHNSLVIAHNEVWANFIEDSEIRCRNGLITNAIRGKSRIFLGPSYIKDDELDFYRNQIQLAEKRLNNQEFVLNEIKDRLEKEKQTLLGYFLRLKEAGKMRVILDSSIVRLFESLKLSFEQYEQDLQKYQKMLNEFLAYKSYLIMCQRAINKGVPPFIKVMGKIDPGVIIATPAHVVKVSRPLEHVAIYMDPITGRLRFTNDFELFESSSEPLAAASELGINEASVLNA